MDIKIIRKKDPKIAALIDKERKRHEETLNLIASENYASTAVREALSSLFIAKYSEGRPYKRYYGGTRIIDELETLVEERVKKVFKISPKKWAVNVQPYSGSLANYAVLRGLLNPGDKIMSLALSHGGHLSQGAKVSLSGQDFKVVNYFVNKKGFLDYREIEKLAKKERPKLIITGYSAYPRKVNFKKFAQIAHKITAYLMADIAHISGLIAGSVHPSPFPFADVVTLTTHKTLRGPRGAIIICREALRKKIFPKVFPGIQGGPHNHTICALGVALKEAQKPQFKKYIQQIVKNAKVLAEELKKYNFDLISGGTDNHLILINLTNKGLSGKEAQNLLEKVGIVTNKNGIPYDQRKPFDPSGLRIGTPSLTSRGMKEKEMRKIAYWINEVIESSKINPPKFCEAKLRRVKREIKKLCKKFPLL
ncbi:MAG TPA: serine hydroxymethyltransferase [Candidatus Nealsonbacteria bacterium]|uniref:Serine hydroxymethyltransferase-like domain-containing protein n=1 Tax=marine sediment metagenome TaxID=412755 RepID=A0A0F9UJN2_9ZZZZ|nr:serine hydroxymethyltransferase [Candidatus Nealsonbacteria bacterium]HEB46429.1 serine hydroxymethyltransferase [Candidatus Nealsonbacteria bacterium]